MKSTKEIDGIKYVDYETYKTLKIYFGVMMIGFTVFTLYLISKSGKGLVI